MCRVGIGVAAPDWRKKQRDGKWIRSFLSRFACCSSVPAQKKKKKVGMIG
jgi:hypothetical protein